MSGSLKIVRELTVGQIAAILNKVSGGDPEILQALLQDKFEICLTEKILKLVDKNGRIIPRGVRAAVCDPNKDYRLVQPSLDYAIRLIHFQEAFKAGPVISAADFESRSKRLIAEIEDNRSLCNLLRGVHLPIILPNLKNFTDYGKTLEEVFLPAVKASYEKQFPGRIFCNYRKGDLAGKVSIMPESRHDRLIAAMKEGVGVVVAIYFPVPLQGFSVFASREQISTLPESLILSGGFDTFSAILMYPDVLAIYCHTPGYDLSALSCQPSGRSLFLRVHDGFRLCFDYMGLLGFSYGCCSSGLLFLG